MAELADLLAPYLGAGETTGLDTPIDPRELTRPGASLREQRSELAEALAGTTDRRSRAYKTARRQAERWLPREGRRASVPSPAARGRLRVVRFHQQANVRAIRDQGASVMFSIAFYEGQRPQWVPAHEYRHIPAATMREVTDLWAEDRPIEAANVLYETFLAAYDVPNPDDWIGNNIHHELRLRPG